ASVAMRLCHLREQGQQRRERVVRGETARLDPATQEREKRRRCRRGGQRIRRGARLLAHAPASGDTSAASGSSIAARASARSFWASRFLSLSSFTASASRRSSQPSSLARTKAVFSGSSSNSASTAEKSNSR